MAINNFIKNQQTLKNYDTTNWSRNIEFGNKINILNSPAESGSPETKSFGAFLQDSISKVNELQSDANIAVEKLASGDSKNLHETLLAVEKADIAFRTMNQVRMKVIDAYKEIMKTQV
jgi:flagellar hook-basal body complex protein FliE